MNNIELLNIKGGTNINGNLLSAISKILSLVLDIGRAIGSSISRYKSGNKCY